MCQRLRCNQRLPPSHGLPFTRTIVSFPQRDHYCMVMDSVADRLLCSALGGSRISSAKFGFLHVTAPVQKLENGLCSLRTTAQRLSMLCIEWMRSLRGSRGTNVVTRRSRTKVKRMGVFLRKPSCPTMHSCCVVKSTTIQPLHTYFSTIATPRPNDAHWSSNLCIEEPLW